MVTKVATASCPQLGHLPPGESTVSETDLSVIGPIGTCVGDLEQALSLLTASPGSEGGGWHLDLPEASFRDVSSLRVAVWADDDFCPVDSIIAHSIHEAADSLEQAGASVNRKARPEFDPETNHRNYTMLLMAAMGAGRPQTVYDKAIKKVFDAEDDDFTEPLLQMRGIALSHRDWLKQNERRLKTRSAWQHFFERYDVLICPSAFTPAFPHDHSPDFHRRRLMVNGVERRYSDLLRWAGLTVNSYLPVTAVPVGETDEGLPVGAQVVSRYLGDKTTLAAARLLEQYHRKFKAPPGFEE